ncbi:CHAT domain-containing protein [uncultured Microscilla sp.]|uniref:CHAT domain-containing protein n=1 Tax=uncultured Microscilla sp. TaxID=432653 RepID=UPI00262C9D7A|nr:CHAT domain-containing protein [uncultured Microscilla sp.]
MRFVISFFFFCAVITANGQGLKSAETLLKTGNFTEAKSIYVNALKGREKCKDSTLLIAKHLITTELLMGNVGDALRKGLYYGKCADAFEIYNLLGAVYSIRRDIDSSLYYYKKSAKGVSDKGKVYNNIGVLYQTNIDSSLYYHTLALKYYQQKQDSIHIARSFNNLAHTLRVNSPDSAIILYQRSLLANQGNNFLMLESFISLSELTKQVVYVHKADSLTRHLQGDIVRRTDKLRLLNQSKRLFKTALSVYTDLYLKTKKNKYFERLFYFSEREKGNILLSQLKRDVLGVKVVQERLKPREVLLEYFQANNKLFCFVVKRSNKQLVKVADITQDSLKRAVQLFIAECNTLGLHDFMKLSPKLYKLLLNNVRGLMIDCEYVTIVPTLLLSNLPFEALMSEQQTMNMQGYQKADYLLKNFSISYHISATLAVVNAGLQYKDGFVGISHSLFKNGLKPLPYGDVEVSVAGRYFKRGVLKNAYNSKELLRSVNAQGLHIATHGYYDERNAESGLWVSSGGRDVVLTVSEVLKIKPRAQLVILSGCSTADGRVVDGEGIVNLPYAFAYAGSRFVISSLWALPDKTTSEFMKLFYRDLRTMSVPEALRSAKIEMIKSTLPFFWTSFVLLGR